MIEMIKYAPEHLKIIREKTNQTLEKPLAINGDAMTLMMNDKPLAIVGGFEIAPGVLQAWSILSEDVCKYPIAITRSVKRLIKILSADKNVRRIQISVKNQEQTSMRWAEFLGFKKEGLMKRYGMYGSDYWLYAWVNP